MTGKASRLPNRLAALALLLAAVGLVVIAVIVPVVGHIRSQHAEIAEQRALLGRLDAFSANRETAKDAAARSEAAMSSGVFLTGGTDALRTANLQALITGIAGKQGVRLSSSRTLAVQEQNGLRFVGVQIEMDTDLARLQRMILALEANRPVLFVRSLQITPASIRNAYNDELHVKLGVAGAVGGIEAKL